MKFPKGVKGVSTVVAQLIMIAATVSAGVVVVAWAGPAFSMYQGNAGIYYQMRSDALKESFVIEDVWFNSTANPRTIDITLRNVGSIEIKVAALYINGTSYSTCNPTCNPTINIGQRSSPIRITYSWAIGKSYVIVVATQRGNQVTSVWGI